MPAPVTIEQIAAIKARTEVNALVEIERLIWPDGPECPRCGSVDQAYRIYRPGSSWASVHRCRNPDCRFSFSPKMGTIFQGSTNMSWRQIINMCQVFSKRARRRNRPNHGAVAQAANITMAAAARYWRDIPRAIERGTIWDDALLEMIRKRPPVPRPRNPSYVERKRRGWLEDAATKEARRKVRRAMITEAVALMPPPPPPPRQEMYWETMAREKREAREAAMAEKKDPKQVAKEAIAKLDKKRAEHPEQFFSPEETRRRFDALVTAMAHTKPVTQEKLAELNRQGKLPHIHELSTEEMERRAAIKSGRVLLVGPDNKPLSDVMQHAIKAHGGSIDERGFGTLPVTPDLEMPPAMPINTNHVCKTCGSDRLWPLRNEFRDYGRIRFRCSRCRSNFVVADEELSDEERAAKDAWRRWEEKLARGEAVGLGPRQRTLTPEERAAIEAYKGEVKRAQTPRRQVKASEALARAKEAVEYCIQTGMSIKDACKETRARFDKVSEIIDAMRERGDNLGLYDFGKSQRRSAGGSKAGRAKRKTYP